MRGKKIDNNIANVEYNENEAGEPFNPNLVTPLERFHDNHENADCRAFKLYRGLPRRASFLRQAYCAYNK